jgi:hypothetical protein
VLFNVPVAHFIFLPSIRTVLCLTTQWLSFSSECVCSLYCPFWYPNCVVPNTSVALLLFEVCLLILFSFSIRTVSCLTPQWLSFSSECVCSFYCPFWYPNCVVLITSVAPLLFEVCLERLQRSWLLGHRHQMLANGPCLCLFAHRPDKEAVPLVWPSQGRTCLTQRCTGDQGFLIYY